MFVKTLKLAKGIPACVVPVSAAEHEGLRTVTTHITAIDAFGISEVVTSLRMTPSEARDFAARVIAAANAAEKL